jgi:hypothetical protein
MSHAWTRRQRRQRASQRTRQTSCLTQTHHHRQDCHLNVDSKHCHHLLRQDKTESLHRKAQAGHSDRDWIAAHFGKVRYDSLKILNLREGATENRRRSESSLPSNVQDLPSRQSQLRIHWYVWWGEAVEFFQQLNNAHSYLWEIL